MKFVLFFTSCLLTFKWASTGRRYTIENESTKLFRIVRMKDVKRVQMFIDSGEDVKLTDKWNQPGRYHVSMVYAPRHKIMTCGRTALHEAAFKCDPWSSPAMLTFLLKKGCKPDIKDEQGRTALHVAAYSLYDNSEIVQILLEHGCKPDEKDEQGRTALHDAADRGLNTTGVIQILLNNGCKPNEKDNKGKTALHYAVDKGYSNLDVIRILIQKGCKPDEKDIQGRTALHVAAGRLNYNKDIMQTLLENGCKPDDTDNQGETALHLAAYGGNKPNLQLLLDSGCNPNIRNVQGETALHLATLEGKNYNIQLLLDNGCNPNIRNVQGRTALHVASAKLSSPESIAIIKILLENGCKPDAKDIQDKTPYMLAKETDNGSKAMKILKDYEEHWQLGLPLEVVELDKKSAKVFASLLEEESYQHYEARVMLAGEPGTGKTTIARFLVGKRPTESRISTDGIDLYKGLSFIDRETDEWVQGKQDFTLSELAISRSLRQGVDTSINPKVKGFRLSEVDVSKSLRKYDCPSINLKQKPKTQDQVKSIGDSLSTLTIEDISLMTYESSYRSSNTQGIATKEQFPIKKSMNDNKDEILMNISRGDREDQGTDDLTIHVDNENSKKMHNNHSRYRKDTEPASADERMLEGKHTTIKAPKRLPSNILETSTEETENKKYTYLPDGLDKNLLQTLDLHVPEKDMEDHSQTGSEKKSAGSSITTEIVNNPGIVGALTKFFGVKRHVEEIKVSMTEEHFLQESLKVGRKKLHQRRIVPVIIWDFGGQDVFYSTHQTFLTYRAIYMIVLDGSRSLDEPCPYEQYLPGKIGPKTAREFGETTHCPTVCSAAAKSENMLSKGV